MTQKLACVAATRAPRNAASTVGVYGTLWTTAYLLGKANICFPDMSSATNEQLCASSTLRSSRRASLHLVIKPQHYDPMRSWSGSCKSAALRSPGHASCIVNGEPLGFRNSLKLTVDMIAKSTPSVSSTSPMACSLCRSQLISAPRCARRSPQHRPFSIRHSDSRIYAKQTDTGESLHALTAKAESLSTSPLSLFWQDQDRIALRNLS